MTRQSVVIGGQSKREVKLMAQHRNRLTDNPVLTVSRRIFALATADNFQPRYRDAERHRPRNMSPETAATEILLGNLPGCLHSLTRQPRWGQGNHINQALLP